ncbi:MAG: uncharacterized protein PWP03_645 [Candidatus Woesearchaeota archaeon]|nr:uncharacterized protein [Candidatus Woesearchaeota archaeon]
MKIYFFDLDRYLNNDVIELSPLFSVEKIEDYLFYIDELSLDEKSRFFMYSDYFLKKIFLFSEKINLNRFNEDKQIYFKTSRKIKFERNRLVLLMNDSCNLNCEFCFTKKGNNLIDFEKIKPFLDNFIKMNVFSDEIYVFFTSLGEVMLNFGNVKKITKYLSDNLLRAAINYSLITNLTILNDEILEFFKKYNFSLIVSYDGPGILSRRRYNPKIEKTVLFNLKRIDQLDLLSRVNVVIGKDHINRKEEVFSFFGKYGNKVSFIPVLYFDRDSKRVFSEISFEEYYSFMKDFYFRVSGVDLKTFLKKKLNPQVCSFKYNIFPDYKIYLCGIEHFYGVKYNKLIDDLSIGSIFDHDYLNYDYLTKVDPYIDDCKSCFYHLFCSACRPLHSTFGPFKCFSKTLVKDLLKVILRQYFLNFLSKN